MRHVAPLSPVASVDCAYFLSPPGVCGPPALSGHSSLANSPLATVLLFSYSYKPLFPQLLSFHAHTKPPGVWGSARLRRSSRHSGVWKGGEVREAFSFAPQVIAAQFAQRVGNEFSADFFAPGHVEIGVVERLANSRCQRCSFRNGL